MASFTPLASAQDAPAAQTQRHQGQDGQDGKKGHSRARHLAKAAIKDASGVIGITSEDLVSQLKAGQSIAQVATAHGVDPQTVIDKLVTDANARIDQAVTDGKIPADKAAEIKGKVTERVTKLVNRVFDGKHKGADKPAA